MDDTRLFVCARCRRQVLVVMETCGGAHHWGREVQQLGHGVRLIASTLPSSWKLRSETSARPRLRWPKLCPLYPLSGNPYRP